MAPVQVMNEASLEASLLRVQLTVSALQRARHNVMQAISDAEAAGATQREVAAAAGVSRTHIWEQEEALPSG